MPWWLFKTVRVVYISPSVEVWKTICRRDEDIKLHVNAHQSDIKNAHIEKPVASPLNSVGHS